MSTPADTAPLTPSAVDAPAAALAGAREWIGLAVIALPCMVYAMDMTVLNLALPAISADLQPSASQLLWIVDIYGFLVAGFLITMGTLGDRIGRRKLLLIGAGAFAAASAVAAFSSSAGMLIAMRALLGVAGATLAPSTLSLIRNMFHDDRQRQFAIGVWIASFSLGAAIGPLVGGVLLQFFHWGSVFLVAVPVMLATLLLGPRLLPEYRDEAAGRVDLASVALCLATVLPLVYGLKIAAEHGFGVQVAGAVLLGLACGALFVRRQRTLDYPLLDLTLFARPNFRAAIVAYALSGLALFGIFIFTAQYLQLVKGLSPLMAGLATVPGALAFVVGSMTAPKLSQSLGLPRVIVWGLVFGALGLGCVYFAGTPQGLAWVVVGNVVMGLAMAPVFTLGNELIITAAPPERAGAASALSETCAEFSGALGIALFGSLGAIVYRLVLADTLPAGLAPAVVTQASSTLGAALAAASELPPDTGPALVDAARGAFNRVLQAIALIGTAILLVTSVLASRMLRHRTT